MPYNPGITAHGGQLLGAGLGRGLQQLADSHKQVGEILNRREEQAKADRQMAKAFGTIIKADQTMQRILSDRLGLDAKDFGDLALQDQLAIGEGMMKLPGIAEAFANAGIRQNQQGLSGKQLQAFDRTNAIDDGVKLAQLAGKEIDNIKSAADIPFVDAMAQDAARKSEASVVESFANAGIRQNQQGLTAKELEAWSRSNAIKDGLGMAQLSNMEISNMLRAPQIDFADAMARDAANLSTANLLDAQTQALLGQETLKNFGKNFELEESKIKVNQLNADTLARKQAMNEAAAAVKLGKAKWSPAQFIKLSPDELKNRLVDIYDEFGPEEFAVAMRAATEALSLNEQMRDKSAGKSTPVNVENGFAPPKSNGQRVRKFDPKSGKLID